MDKPMIGIRQADGSFYEIMGDAQTGRKRLVLSAARTDQHGVRIDLYRSVDGSLTEAHPLGTIALDDPEGLGYKDIEFQVDLDSDGLMEASAALPGQPPRTISVDLSPYQGPRTDADILASDNVEADDLDTLDDSFTADANADLEPQSMVLDLPEVDEPGDVAKESEEPPRRTDADILGDETLASAELDDLDDFSFDAPPPEIFDEPDVSAEPEAALGDLDDLKSLDNLDAPAAADSFDLGDLDAGFGADEPEAPADVAEQAPAAAEDWEKISLDDMESMEFMDTGDEISAPSSKPPAAPEDHDDFSFDEHSPLELSDLDSDLSDLSDLDDLGSDKNEPSGSLDDLDHDFLPPPALTESTDWELEEPVASPAKASKAAKPAKALKVAREAKPARVASPAEAGSASRGLDKTALFLSLVTLSLLVLLILVLLFLNMIKAPASPVIQPEVQRWKPVATLASSATTPEALAIDLGSQPVSFEASSVLEVPEGLKSAKISLRLQNGETAADAERRFGKSARSQGNLLFW